MQPSLVLAFIHSNPSQLLIRKYWPLSSASSWFGAPHREHISLPERSFLRHLFPPPAPLLSIHWSYRWPNTDISRSSSSLALSTTRCLSPRWHSIIFIFISWDEHGFPPSTFIRMMPYIDFYHPGVPWINPSWLWCIILSIASSFSLIIFSGGIVRDTLVVSLACLSI